MAKVTVPTVAILANVITVEWPRDTMDDSWSTLPQDAGGSVALVVRAIESGTQDLIQMYARFNVTDGDLAGDQQTTPLVTFQFTYTAPAPSDYVKYGRGTPLTLIEATDFISDAGKSDWGSVEDKDLTTAPVSPVDNETHIIAGIGGLWSPGTINDIAKFATEITAWRFKTPVDGDFVFVKDEDLQYRYDGAAWNAEPLGEVNSASNVGGFTNVFKQKTGTDLEFKTLQSSDNSLGLTGNVSDVDIVLDKQSITGQPLVTALDADSVLISDASDTGNLKKALISDFSNKTHTGDVTGSVALLLQPVAITSQTTVTSASGDFVLISDTSDSGNLKKADVSDFAGETNTLGLDAGATGADITSTKVGLELKVKGLLGGEGVDATIVSDDIVLDLDTAGLSEELTPANGDEFIIWDGVSHKRMDFDKLPGAAGGEANTASNVGSGADIFKQKSGVDLEFRGLVATGDGTAVVNADNIDLTFPRVGVYRNIYIDAAACVPRTTNGAEANTKEFATNDIMIDYFAFDSTTEEGIQFKLMMPDEWDRSTIKFKFFWDAAATASGTVIWGVRAGALSNDDPIDASLGTQITVTDTLLAVGDMHVSPATAAVTVGGTPALEDMVIVQIVATTGGTIAVDQFLMGIAIQFLELSSEPTQW